MTVSTEDVVHRYRPGDAMAPESIPFQFLDAADLTVTIDIATDAALVVGVPLVPGVDYTIAGNGMARAGAITAHSARVSSEIWRIARVSEQLQKTSIPPHEPLPALAAERQLDRLTLVDQEQAHGLAAQGEAIRRLQAGTLQVWFDPGVDPDLGIYFDPGVDPLVDLRFDPGEY